MTVLKNIAIRQGLVDHNVVNALLLVDQMASFVHQTHQLVNAMRPIVENVGRRLLRFEMNDASRTINFHRDRCTVSQSRQVLFSLGFWQVQQLTHTIDINAGVVVGQDSNVLCEMKLEICTEI